MEIVFMVENMAMTRWNFFVFTPPLQASYQSVAICVKKIEKNFSNVLVLFQLIMTQTKKL